MTTLFAPSEIGPQIVKVSDRITALRYRESVGRGSRTELIAFLEEEIERLAGLCDLPTGYSSDDDPFSGDAVAFLRHDFAELTARGNPYPIPEDDARPRCLNGRLVDYQFFGHMAAPEAELSAAEQITRFLRTLYAPYKKGWIEMRGICPVSRKPSGRPGATINRERTAWTWREWYPLAETRQDSDRLIADARGLERDLFDVYVGALPRGIHGKAKKTDIYEAGAAWAELDFDKQNGGEEAVLSMAVAAGADILVRSGGGVHVYWMFCEPIALDDLGVARFEKSLRKRQSAMKTDPVHDVTRILRLPGTSNFKRPNDTRRVELVTWN